MNYLLDTLWATVIGGFVILMMIRFNSDISTSSYEMLTGQISQTSAIEATEISGSG